MSGTAETPGNRDDHPSVAGNADHAARVARLAEAYDTFADTAAIYRAVAARVARLGPLADDARLDQAQRQVVSIALGTCVDQVVQGADIAEQVIGRIAAALAEEGVPLSPPPPSAHAAIPAPDACEATPPAPEIDLAHAARELAIAAAALEESAKRVNLAASGLHDRELTGDPHPYGDVIYGIPVLYFARAAELLDPR